MRTSLTMRVEASSSTQLDDVAVSYAGKIEIVGIQVDFPCLVRAAARAMALRIRDEHLRIQNKRPLLPSEEDYLMRIEEAASIQ